MTPSLASGTAGLLDRLRGEIPWVALHGERVGRLAAEFARALGRSEFECDLLLAAGALHDAGKMGVPRALIDKPESLTVVEMDEVKRHAECSAALVIEADPTLTRVARLCREHHEWYDGTGYPAGLTMAECDPLQPILVLADTFDSITNERPYRGASAFDAALAEISGGKGSQFDNNYATAFLVFLRRRTSRPRRARVSSPRGTSA